MDVPLVASYYCPVYFRGYGLRNLNQAYHHFFAKTTRMHSSRMRSARSLTMGGSTCPGLYLPGGVPAWQVFVDQAVSCFLLLIAWLVDSLPYQFVIHLFLLCSI